MTAHIPREFEVEMVSGHYLDVVAPDPSAITLDDIATPLAKQCRYGGACRDFFSVAEHAVLVARKLRRLGAPLSLQFAGLHHDDAEAFLSDIQRPAKLALAHEGDGHGYDTLTTRLDLAIQLALAWCPLHRLADPPFWRVDDLHDPLVKQVDTWACAFEAQRVMPSQGANWEQVWLQSTRDIPEDKHDTVRCLEWRPARTQFAAMHRLLVRDYHVNFGVAA